MPEPRDPEFLLPDPDGQNLEWVRKQAVRAQALQSELDEILRKHSGAPETTEETRDALYATQGEHDDQEPRQSGHDVRTGTTTSHLPLFVGIGGRLRAGKDAVADFLVEHYGFTKLGMSDALHQFLMDQNPILGEWLDYLPTREEEDAHLIRYRDLTQRLGYVEAKKTREYRRLLMDTGTEAGRKLDVDLWVKAAADRITAARERGERVVVTGIRYQNELAMVERLGGRTLWISRPDAEREIEAVADLTDHTSETSVFASDFTLEILNDAGLAELKVKTGLLVATLEALQ